NRVSRTTLGTGTDRLTPCSTPSPTSTETALSVSTSTTARREDTTHNGSYVAFRSSGTDVRTTGSPPRVIVNRRNRESARVYDQWVSAFSYPLAERLETVDELHGHRVPDPYRWLEDPADPRTREWAEQQDDLTAGYLSGLPG